MLVEPIRTSTQKTDDMILKTKHKLIVLATVLLFVSAAPAQLYVSNGATVYIGTGASVVVQSNMTNAGTITDRKSVV